LPHHLEMFRNNDFLLFRNNCFCFLLLLFLWEQLLFPNAGIISFPVELPKGMILLYIFWNNAGKIQV
jgi:hypothetical protein